MNTVDPLGGSYYLEALTEKMEQTALEYFRKIDAMGEWLQRSKKDFPSARFRIRLTTIRKLSSEANR